MRRFVLCGLLAAAALAGPGAALAGEYGQHYYSGTDGLKAGSPTAPGFALNLRTSYYYSDDWHDDGGDKSYAKREIFFVEPELAWTSREPLWLGARYSARISMPMLYHQEDMAVKNSNPSRDHITGYLGDLRLTPVQLGWSLERFDITAGYTVFMPTGNYDHRPSGRPNKSDRPNSGKGYWTHMLSLGGTAYLDCERAWHASIMTHYEIHTRQDETDIRWGDNFHFEGGVGKDFCGGWRAGLIGYGSVQTRNDSVRGGADDGRGRRVFAAGAEIGYFNQTAKIPWSVAVRGAQEFAAKGNYQGFRSLLSAGIAF